MIEPFGRDWFYRRSLGPFAAVGGEQVELIPVTLPHDAQRDTDRSPDAPGRGAGAYFPPGSFTYLKTFPVPASWADKVVALELQGAYRHAMVFVNDELAGNRADGYARFLVDLKPFLRVGADNELRVEVRSGQDSRWYSGCGLHRPVLLHVNELVHVVPDGVRITTLDLEPDLAVLEVATTLTNRTASTETVDLSTTITDADDRAGVEDETPVTLAPGETTTVRRRLYLAEPRSWSPTEPHRYRCRTTVRRPGHDHDDPVITRFGVRTLQVDPRHGLRINGEPVLLRGACLHHDNGPLGAAAIERAEERRIELLQQAGFNAIRAAHNPLSPAMLEACDRLGVLVMDEAFDCWSRFKTPYDYALDFPQWWAADVDSMIAKDYNHPSVIMYSIGNEIVETGTPHGSRMARRLADHLRTQDPTRLVTNGVNAALAVLDELPAVIAEARGDGAADGASGGLNDLGDAMNTLGSSERATARIEESSAALDVLGLNYAEGRYAADASRYPHRVIVGSETFPTRIGDLWPMVVGQPHVIGDFTWTGWDYLGEVGIGATTYAEHAGAVAALEREFPYLTAWCGDLDITGWRRPVSFYREIVFGLRAEPYLAVRRPEHHDHTITMQSPWAWSDAISSWTWPGFEGRPVTVEVYADADEVVLLLDESEIARGRVGEQRPLMAVLETTYSPGALVAVGYRDGVENGRTSLSTAGDPTLTATADRTALRADDTDLAYVAIELRDAAGHLVASADRPITVAVSGAAVLAGLCSANPSTTERFGADTWRTFDGRALAVVRPIGPGPITVEIRAGDLDVVTLELAASR
ncbi:MAG TPA: glycoside hydrolase family 2 TIM barrel-domain containing protein [Microlunatus sp.]